MNYCSECGYKLEGEFKFCPNCGSNINSRIISNNGNKSDSINFIICKNCGEENSTDNFDCFSCGIPLSNSKNKRKPGKSEKNNKNIVAIKNSVTSNKILNEEKVLDNKKIFIIFSLIVIVFIFALITSGVFDTGVTNDVSQMTNQSANTGVNLASMEEINQLETKINANPDDLESTLHLAHLQQDAGLSEKAIVNYNRYLTKFPENADARVDMAICFYNLGDYNKAISEMELAIEYQPKHQIAHLNLGIVNLAATNVDASKAWFKKTVELDPNSEAGKRAQELLNSH